MVALNCLLKELKSINSEDKLSSKSRLPHVNWPIIERQIKLLKHLLLTENMQ